MKNDTDLTIEEISRQKGVSIIDQLIEFQDYAHPDEKHHEWADNLQCLQVDEQSSADHELEEGGLKYLRKVRLRQDLNEAYIAVSYPYTPDQNEGDPTHTYHIIKHDGSSRLCKVRDSILDRTIHYMRHHGRSQRGRPVRGFWIDIECIDPRQKELAINSMDLVYRSSKKSVGLLSVQMDHNDAVLFDKLLRGTLLRKSRGPPALMSHVKPAVANEVLDLLKCITSDRWWDRAWIFQEEYLSSKRMDLLLGYRSGVLGPGLRKTFGSLQGELQFKADKFRIQATLFCLAYLTRQPRVSASQNIACREVLSKIVRYTVMFQYGHLIDEGGVGRSMSSGIFKEISTRGISRAEDLLAIAANCCGYDRRLDTSSLQNQNHLSLSISIIALCLLNGEIFKRDVDTNSKVFEFLRRQAFDRFDPPEENRKLTFLKHSRLSNVQFSKLGVETSGYLWKFGKKLVANDSFREFGDEEGLDDHQVAEVFKQLAEDLREDGHEFLADELDDYFKHSVTSSADTGSYMEANKVMNMMAKRVASNIIEGQPFFLGCLDQKTQSPYRAIFSAAGLEVQKDDRVFVAWDDGIPSLSQASDDSSKYVSLLVSKTDEPGQPPQLAAKSWINGLCFFHERSPRHVLFPWPSSLTKS